MFDDGAVQPNPPGAPTGGRQTTFTEGFVQWNIPIGSGVTAKFGKFLGWLGYEIWGSIWNPNYTLSYSSSQGAFGNATGLALSYDVTDRFTSHYYLTNTTGTFVNNNKSLSHGIELNYVLPDSALLKKGWINFGALWGPEHAGNDSDWTQRYDLTVSLTPFDKLTFVTHGNWVYDPTRIVQPSGRAKNDNNAWGVVQYIIYDYTDSVEFTVRGEYYWDQDNVLGISGGDGASLAEVTGTINIKLSEGLLLRPEIRYDKIISVPDGPSHTWHRQNKNITGLIGVSYQF
ncbi:MAG: outer membrane beta-barrel protein [Planctomycetota bacterium]